MKFDYVIGNPPYQDETIGDNSTYAPPVYNKFLDAAYSISDKVEMVHPARFLANAGSTPKAWNEKMLNDSHLKILYYAENSSELFANTDIKGGVVISYHDMKQEYTPIGIFTPFMELNHILHKVLAHSNFIPLSSIIVTSYAYHFTEKLYEDFPDEKGALSTGHEFDLKSNVFTKLQNVFHEKLPEDSHSYIRILGRENNERAYYYINENYVNKVSNLHYYKAFLSGATGKGEFGEALTMPIIGYPKEGSTETFMSLGAFKTEDEVKALIRYIQTKFARCLLGILKKTQANTPEKWKYVPLQDFTPTSDIDWSKSIPEIDQQLALVNKNWTRN